MRAAGVPPPPPRGLSSGRLMRMAGMFGILVGAAIIVGTATGTFKGGGDKSLGYMVGGLVAAYGLFRYLRGRSGNSGNGGLPPSSRYQR